MGVRSGFAIHHSTTAGAVVAQGDFFNATAAEFGQFDKAWDRLGLNAIAPGDTQKYADKLSELVKSGGKLLLESLSGNRTSYRLLPYTRWPIQTVAPHLPAPPLCMRPGDGADNQAASPDAVKKAFGGKWEVQVLGSESVAGSKAYRDYDTAGLTSNTFLLTRK